MYVKGKTFEKTGTIHTMLPIPLRGGFAMGGGRWGGGQGEGASTSSTSEDSEDSELEKT